MKRLPLVLVLIGAAGTAHAQMMSQPDPARGGVQINQNGNRVDGTDSRVDPYGNRYVGSDTWRRGPGDPKPGTQPQQMGQALDGATKQSTTNVPRGAQPSVTGQPPAQGRGQAAFKDEFGFRYDDKGNRIDARGNIISPQTKTR